MKLKFNQPVSYRGVRYAAGIEHDIDINPAHKKLFKKYTGEKEIDEVTTEGIVDDEGNPIGDDSTENDESTTDNTSVVDYSEFSMEELIEFAKEEGLTVVRGDGKTGNPLKQDYIDALTKGGE